MVLSTMEESDLGQRGLILTIHTNSERSEHMTQIHLRSTYLTLLPKNGTLQKHDYHGMPRQLLEHVLGCCDWSAETADEFRITIDNELLLGPVTRQGLVDLLFRRANGFQGPPYINLGCWFPILQGVEREDGSGRRFNLALSLPEHGGIKATMFVKLED